MEHHTLELRSSHFDPAVASRYAMNAILGTDSLSVLVADEAGAVVELKSWLFDATAGNAEALEWDMRRILHDEPLFALPFGHVHCALFHRNATLVPRRLFAHSALPDYFKLLLPASEYSYAYDELPEVDACLVYATAPWHARIVGEVFTRARCRHLAAPLLRYFHELAGTEEHSIFVHFRHQTAQIAVFERQNLLFYNVFSFAASSDLLYYVLLIYDQFRLSPQEIPLRVSGTLVEDAELYRLLYRFIRSMLFVPLPAYYRIPPDIQVLPDHCYTDLFCLKNL